MKPWLIALALSLGPAVTNGFGRLGYALILPAMRSDLSWSYAEAGFMNSAHSFGYLVGAVATFRWMHRASLQRLFWGGMLATALGLLASGLTTNFYLLSSARVFAGAGAAPSFIAGGALAATLFADQPRRNALAIALYFGGAGIGITLSGILLPLMLEQWGPSAWPVAWQVLGIASLIGLAPAVGASYSSTATSVRSHARVMLPWRAMIPSLTGYFLFSASFIVYMTFIVAWMRDQHVSTAVVVIMWSTLGVAVIASPFVWQRLLALEHNALPMTLSIVGTAIGSLLPVITTTFAGLVVSATIFGLCFFVVPAAVTSFAKKNLPPSCWGAAIALYTSLLALGQVVGPIAAGCVAEMTEGLAWSLTAGTAVLLIASAVTAFQRGIAHRKA